MVQAACKVSDSISMSSQALSSIALPVFPGGRWSHTELVEAEDEDRLVDLESKDLRLDERDGLAVDLDEALALLAVGDSGGGLLLAEALDALGGRHGGDGCVELSKSRLVGRRGKGLSRVFRRAGACCEFSTPRVRVLALPKISRALLPSGIALMLGILQFRSTYSINK